MKLPTSRLGAHQVCALGLLLLASCARVQREVPTNEQTCSFSGPPKSSLSWQSGRGDFTLRGRVVSVRDGRPRADATVWLRPGGREARTDGAGTFELRRLRGGRYEVEVRATGGVPAVDSITVGDDGVDVLAAIADYTIGLMTCVRVTNPQTR